MTVNMFYKQIDTLNNIEDSIFTAKTSTKIITYFHISVCIDG